VRQQPPSKSSGLLRKYAPHAAARLVLIAAGLTLPELPVLKGAAGTNLRAVLLSGFVALVPLDADSLNRIPDAFAEAVKPNWIRMRGATAASHPHRWSALCFRLAPSSPVRKDIGLSR
jgi:hypothetical protein